MPGTGTQQQPRGAAGLAARTNALPVGSGSAEDLTAARTGEAPAAATILCPLPVSQAAHSSRVGCTAVHPQQGHGGPSQAAAYQAPCRYESGSHTQAAGALDGVGSAALAKPVLKRRRVQSAFKAPRAVAGQENSESS